jgi:hypothetical protein
MKIIGTHKYVYLRNLIKEDYSELRKQLIYMTTTASESKPSNIDDKQNTHTKTIDPIIPIKHIPPLADL